MFKSKAKNKQVMSRVVVWLFLGLALAFVACQSGGVATLTEEEKEAIKKDILARIEFWRSSANELDFDKGMTVHPPDPDFEAATDGTLWRTRAECERVIRPYMAGLREQEIKYDEIHIKVLSPEIAIQSALGTIIYTDTTGYTSDLTPYALTAVWVKRDGQWLVTQFHQSVP